jgi:hypothetical protein
MQNPILVQNLVDLQEVVRALFGGGQRLLEEKNSGLVLVGELTQLKHDVR